MRGNLPDLVGQPLAPLRPAHRGRFLEQPPAGDGAFGRSRPHHAAPGARPYMSAEGKPVFFYGPQDAQAGPQTSYAQSAPGNMVFDSRRA